MTDTDKTAQAILAMPDDANFYLSRTFPSIGRTLQGYGNDGTILHLKTMAKLWLMREEIVEAVEDWDAFLDDEKDSREKGVENLLEKLKALEAE